jgi:hypothetical protein
VEQQAHRKFVHRRRLPHGLPAMQHLQLLGRLPAAAAACKFKRTGAAVHF